MKLLLGLCHRLAYATLISLIVFLAAIWPEPYKGHQPSQAASVIVRILDAPIALAGLLVPCPYRGVDLVTPARFSCSPLPSPSALWYHLAIGIPAYLLLFYLPSFLLIGRRQWHRRRGATLPVVVLLAFTVAASPAFSAGRGPSTSEERSKAVNLVRALEADPLNEGARDSRRWLVAWLSEIPDITVQMCPALLGENFEVNKKYAAELALQQSLSSAAFIIEHPDRANDKLAVSIAGVEGVFKAYEAILTQKPKAHFKSLDALLEARSKGTLESIVAQNMKACT
jgi:hypothetical protein